MKMIKKVPLVLSAILLMSTITAFAKDVTLKVTTDGTNTTAVESNLYGTIDNSDLQVNVVKQIGEETSIIYTGKLGEYEDGAWSNIDFSGIDFLLLFEWESSNNEALYIIPLEQPSNNLLNAVINENSAPSSNVTLTYNNDYYEGELKLNNTLNVEIDVENVTKDLVCYIAEYDNTGKLIDLIRGAKIVVPTTDTSNGKFSIVATKTFTDSNAVNSKIMIWEDNTIRPITNAIELNSQTCDYYADDISTAQLYDISRKFYGKINSTDDVDYIKFQPSVSGEYTIGTSADMEITGTLYDEQGEILSECNSIADGYYIKEYLTAENTYYLKTTAAETGEYSISIQNTENVPFNVILTDNSVMLEQDCENGEYTISLYDDSGTTLQTVSSSVMDNGLFAEMTFESSSPAYSIAVKKGDFIISAYAIKTVEESKQFNTTKNNYVSVPVTVFNIADLSNIYFTIAFDATEFSVFDVCEHTHNVSETGTGLISNAEVNIKAIKSDAVVFTSTKSPRDNAVIDVNTVKLQAQGNGIYTVKTIAYSVK